MASTTIGFSVYCNGKLVDELRIDRPVFNIGKLSTSTVRLDDVNVSRKHAVVEQREDGSWRITDLGSTNGTLLAGERIEQSLLRDGDRLVIGRTTLVVHLPEAPPAPAPAVSFVAPTPQSGTAGDTSPAPARVPAPVRAPAPPLALAPMRANGFRLPSGGVGHILSMLGALVFLAGTLLLPWLRFDLAALAPRAPETGFVGLLMTIVGGATLAASTWGFVTGRRHAAARINLVASLAAIAWLAITCVSLAGGARLMPSESVSLGVGFVVAAWGAVVMLAGAGVVFAALPRWDESTSFLRLLLSRGAEPLRDVVVYEPRVIELGSNLPRFEVTREGDSYVHRDGKRTPIVMGERGSFEVDSTRVHYLFVKPIAGRGAVALTSWLEASAFATLALLVMLSLGMWAILSDDAHARRTLPKDEPRTALIEPVMVEDKVEEKVVVVQVELPPVEIPKVEDIADDEPIGDDSDTDERLAEPDEDVAERPSELVNRLDPQKNEPIDLKNLTPTERSEVARQRAQQTALAQQLDPSNPLVAQLMTLNTDVDARVNIAAAIDAQGNFQAGNVDPFGNTLGGPGGFPGGPEGNTPPGGPDGPTGPYVADAFKDARKKRNLDDVGMTERKITIAELPHRQRGEGLDAKTVQQYIRRNLNGVKWCYQDRLQANRSLAGKLTLDFTIMPDGTVRDAKTTNSTLGDAPLEACIAAKMSRWKFPSPLDGGIVDVAYPLILKTPD